MYATKYLLSLTSHFEAPIVVGLVTNRTIKVLDDLKSAPVHTFSVSRSSYQILQQYIYGLQVSTLHLLSGSRTLRPSIVAPYESQGKCHARSLFNKRISFYGFHNWCKSSPHWRNQLSTSLAQFQTTIVCKMKKKQKSTSHKSVNMKCDGEWVKGNWVALGYREANLVPWVSSDSETWQLRREKWTNTVQNHGIACRNWGSPAKKKQVSESFHIMKVKTIPDWLRSRCPNENFFVVQDSKEGWRISGYREVHKSNQERT